MKKEKNLEKKALELLNKTHLKRTPGRIALLQLLLEAKNPLTKQEISAKLSGVQMDSVSIYRSLEAFHRAGIVHKVEAGDRNWRFAVCSCGSSKHCHPHFICRLCGKVECLEGSALPEELSIKPGYVVEEQELYLRGLCDRCFLREKSPPKSG